MQVPVCIVLDGKKGYRQEVCKLLSFEWSEFRRKEVLFVGDRESREDLLHRRRTVTGSKVRVEERPVWTCTSGPQDTGRPGSRRGPLPVLSVSRLETSRSVTTKIVRRTTLLSTIA